MKEENAKLRQQIEDLKTELCLLKETKTNSMSERSLNTSQGAESQETDNVFGSPQGSAPISENSSRQRHEQLKLLQQQVVQAHQELSRAKEALLGTVRIIKVLFYRRKFWKKYRH